MKGLIGRLVGMAALAGSLAAGTPAARTATPPAAVADALTTGLAAYLADVAELKRRKDWPGLEQLARRALRDLDARPGASDVDTSAALVWLAVALRKQGREAEAETQLKRELAVIEKVKGPTSTDVADLLVALGDCIDGQSRYGDAEIAYRRAVAIREAALGRDHPATGAALNRLGDALALQHRWADAEAAHHRAYDIERSTAGPTSPTTLSTLEVLEGDVFLQRRFAEAEALARQLLDGRQATLGQDDPATISAVVALAGALRQEAKDREAVTLYARAIAADEKRPGFNPAELAKILSDQGFSLKQIGRYDEAEAAFQRVLSVDHDAGGAQTASTARHNLQMGLLYLKESRPAVAETWIRRALAVDVGLSGPDSWQAAADMGDLAEALQAQGHYAAADRLYRRALEIDEKASATAPLVVPTDLHNLAGLLKAEGDPNEAERLLRRALAIAEKEFGPQAPETTENLASLAMVMEDQGRDSEAESFYRRALATDERMQGVSSPAVAYDLDNLGAFLVRQAKGGEAESLLRRSVAIDETSLGADHPVTAAAVTDLARALFLEGNRDEAEALALRVFALAGAASGSGREDRLTDLNNLAVMLLDGGAPAEAERLLRQSLAMAEKAPGPDSPAAATALHNLGSALREQRRFAEAEPLLARALRIDERGLGAAHPTTLEVEAELATVEAEQKKFEPAMGHFRKTCAGLAQAAGRSDRAAAGGPSRSSSRTCSEDQSIALWDWSGAGGGPAVGNRPEALRNEAFVVAQRAVGSAAGDALARSGALLAAKAAGVESEASAYESALVDRERLDRRLAAAAADASPDGVTTRASLARDRDVLIDRIATLAAAIATKSPRYWNYRAPEPVSVGDLQGTQGSQEALLHDDEALLAFIIPAGERCGLVFAVSRQRAAWAQITVPADELRAGVASVRASIDKRRRAFDRSAAFVLYVSLLGDPAIQMVIRDKPTLLFVPTGPLTSLPPGLLVTRPPAGGSAGDSQQQALRETPWLLRSKAVALLPSVSSLKTLRQLLPANHVPPPDPLLAFADPDFGGTEPAGATGDAGVAPRGFTDYFRDGHPMGDALHTLPRLAGTRVEGEALVSALGGQPGSLLTGAQASKAELMRRNADGRLARVRVLEFATHGLVAGAASWLAEPALAMAAGSQPEDELLLASEASTLKLNSDWVLLSACNTASPDAPEAEGLSGLSRAFFHAGARSLLVSHWPVQDAVASRLVPSILLAERDSPGIGHAEALRRASLAILDDPKLNAANPAAWAPFTIVGEPAR